jgi:hypothetical protein
MHLMLHSSLLAMGTALLSITISPLDGQGLSGEERLISFSPPNPVSHRMEVAGGERWESDPSVGGNALMPPKRPATQPSLGAIIPFISDYILSPLDILSCALTCSSWHALFNTESYIPAYWAHVDGKVRDAIMNGLDHGTACEALPPMFRDQEKRRPERDTKVSITRMRTLIAARLLWVHTSKGESKAFIPIPDSYPPWMRRSLRSKQVPVRGPARGERKRMRRATKCGRWLKQLASASLSSPPLSVLRFIYLSDMSPIYLGPSVLSAGFMTPSKALCIMDMYARYGTFEPEIDVAPRCVDALRYCYEMRYDPALSSHEGRRVTALSRKDICVLYALMNYAAETMSMELARAVSGYIEEKTRAQRNTLKSSPITETSDWDLELYNEEMGEDEDEACPYLWTVPPLAAALPRKIVDFIADSFPSISSPLFSSLGLASCGASGSDDRFLSYLSLPFYLGALAAEPCPATRGTVLSARLYFVLMNGYYMRASDELYGEEEMKRGWAYRRRVENVHEVFRGSMLSLYPFDDLAGFFEEISRELLLVKYSDDLYSIARIIVVALSCHMPKLLVPFSATEIIKRLSPLREVASRYGSIRLPCEEEVRGMDEEKARRIERARSTLSVMLHSTELSSTAASSPYSSLLSWHFHDAFEELPDDLSEADDASTWQRSTEPMKVIEMVTRHGYDLMEIINPSLCLLSLLSFLSEVGGEGACEIERHDLL